MRASFHFAIAVMITLMSTLVLFISLPSESDGQLSWALQIEPDEAAPYFLPGGKGDTITIELVSVTGPVDIYIMDQRDIPELVMNGTANIEIEWYVTDVSQGTWNPKIHNEGVWSVVVHNQNDYTVNIDLSVVNKDLNEAVANAFFGSMWCCFLVVFIIFFGLVMLIILFRRRR
jgi:hypothetical protein